MNLFDDRARAVQAVCDHTDGWEWQVSPLRGGELAICGGARGAGWPCRYLDVAPSEQKMVPRIGERLQRGAE